MLAVAIVAVIAWVVFSTLWLWKNQERVVFQPPDAIADAPAPARRVSFASRDGVHLIGFVVGPARHPVTPTLVIAFHGNADLAAWTVPWARELAERTGATVFVPEYRGYSGIPGTPTYETAAIDASAALAFAQQQLRPERLVLYGHSLGTAIASELAAHAQPAPAALVLESPFTSARDMAARMLVPPIPWLWSRISRVHYDTRSLVGRLDCPVFVAHGSRDINIPVRMGRQVYLAARRQGALLIVDGAGHNDVSDVGGERYWSWMVAAVGVPASALPRASAAR